MSEKTEEQGIEVFGTKEVSVKEFMGGTDKSLMLLSNYELAKENLDGLKEKHEARVDELVSIEKLSPAELKELNSIRGELREPRYLVQKIEKNNISIFETYKKTDKANLKALIDILKPTEDKADDKIKAEEERKKNEKAEAERLEQLRIDTIKNKIDEFETGSYKIIHETKFADIDANQIKLQALESAEFDYEEYDILFEQAKTRVENQWNTKVADLQEKETQRLDNIRLEEEAKEQKRISDLQAERLKQILPYVAFGEAVDLTKLSELDKGEYESILLAKKCLFEVKEKENERLAEEAAAKAKEESDAVFEIRRNRLAEIGMARCPKVFVHADEVLEISVDDVYNADTLGFENILFNAKKTIQEAKAVYEKELAKEKETESRIAKLLEIGLHHSDEHGTYFVATDSDWMVLTEDVSDATPEDFEELLLEAKQAISDYKKSKEDSEKLKKENKARVKRLAWDKECLLNHIGTIDIGLIPVLDNQEATDFFNEMNNSLKAFKNEWIDKLEKL